MSSYRVDFVSDLPSDEVPVTSSRRCGSSSTSLVIKRSDVPSSIIEDGDILHHSSWTEFCDQIDAALIPLTTMNRRNYACSFCVIILSLCLFASAPILYVLLKRHTHIHTNTDGGDSSKDGQQEDDSSSIMVVWPLTLIGIACTCIPLIGICYMAASDKKRDGQVCWKLDEICREASGTPHNPNIHFSLKHEAVYNGNEFIGERKYIEMEIKSPSNADADADDDTDNEMFPIKYQIPDRPGTPETICSPAIYSV
uniref:Uncharacterized protein n=1 Tax=Chaetoceros debilis TaxID=122233 RepID=A0A7S3QA76_9STRA|mmetsp:Transcript_23261/g.34497  ORF Transcript_23261/g.34497 Transcript_23261/m.34497 type:complete len:254 (-) Transcript_23261:54-815(-)